MTLSRKTIETLIDLVEIKLSCIETYDNQDSRVIKSLEQCRDELRGLTGKGLSGKGLADKASTATIVAMGKTGDTRM